jgi:hypothetical protein
VSTALVTTPIVPELVRGALALVRDELARVVAERTADDPHLAYLDGRALYGEVDARAFGPGGLFAGAGATGAQPCGVGG